MQKVTLFLLLVCVPVFAKSKWAPVDVRVIRICALDDVSNPVPKQKIRQWIDEVSADFSKQEIGLTFKVVDLLDYTDSKENADMGELTHCPDSDFSMLFTNREVKDVEQEESAQAKTGKKQKTKKQDEDDYYYLTGMSFPEYGAVVMYSADNKKLLGKFTEEWKIKHELGHMFGLDDDQDRDGFMTAYTDKGKPAWTRNIKKQFIANRNIKFPSY